MKYIELATECAVVLLERPTVEEDEVITQSLQGAQTSSALGTQEARVGALRLASRSERMHRLSRVQLVSNNVVSRDHVTAQTRAVRVLGAAEVARVLLLVLAHVGQCEDCVVLLLHVFVAHLLLRKLLLADVAGKLAA